MILLCIFCVLFSSLAFASLWGIPAVNRLGQQPSSNGKKTAETIEVLKSEPQTPATKRAIEVLTENQRALGDCSGKIADLELDTAEAQRDKWRWSAISLAIGAALGLGGSFMVRR